MSIQTNSLIIRSSSKLTDEMITIDSPSRRSKSGIKSMYQTIQFMKKLSQSKNTTLQPTHSLWLESASSIRREKSPSHKFPQAQRFSSFEQDQRKNRLILKLNIASELSNSKGIAFPKSKRADYFRSKKFCEDYPSPAAYSSEILASSIEGKRVTTAFGKRSSIIKLSEQLTSQQIKGVTIPKQKNPSKVFMHHGQKLPYQPQVTIQNPGVGKYFTNPQNTFSTKKYKFGKTLKKFNELIPQHPGPGAYGVDKQIVSKRTRSANFKGTFPLSKRTYLVPKSPQQYSPCPNSYKIKRFLEK